MNLDPANASEAARAHNAMLEMSKTDVAVLVVACNNNLTNNSVEEIS